MSMVASRKMRNWFETPSRWSLSAAVPVASSGTRAIGVSPDGDLPHAFGFEERLIVVKHLAVLGNIVTSWSWFGVNELGVGLHSYGFTEGVVPTLVSFWGSQLAIIAIGLLPTTMWWSYKAEEKLKKSKPLRTQVAT